jgi:hypothetical protein
MRRTRNKLKKKRFRRITVRTAAVSAALVCAIAYGGPLTSAWYVSGVSPFGTQVTTATIQIDGPSTGEVAEFKNLAAQIAGDGGYVAGQGLVLPSFTIKNESSRGVMLEIEPKIDAYLKIMDYRNAADSTKKSDLIRECQNGAYLFGGGAQTPETPYAIYKEFSTAAEKLAGEGYILDTGEYGAGADGKNSVYLLVDGALADKKQSLDGAAKKIAYGTEHFAAVRQYMSDYLMESSIKAFLDAASLDGDSLDMGAEDGVVYDDGGSVVYLDQDAERFYVWLAPPSDSGEARTELEFRDINVEIPTDLCGYVSAGKQLPSSYWKTEWEESDKGRYTSGYGKDENSPGDPSADARLNEQGAMFSVSIGARAVQGTKDAVEDIFGESVADVYAGKLSA